MSSAPNVASKLPLLRIRGAAQIAQVAIIISCKVDEKIRKLILKKWHKMPFLAFFLLRQRFIFALCPCLMNVSSSLLYAGVVYWQRIYSGRRGSGGER
jgi:hypothetical protein